MNGNLLVGNDALEYLQKLSNDTKNAQWARPISALITDLINFRSKALETKTSGTTGVPKAIRIPRRDLVASAKLTARSFKLKEGARVLLCLPGNFIAGKMMVVRAMVTGSDLHMIDPRGSVMENLRSKDRFQFTAMIPLQLHRAIQEDRARVQQQFDTILLGGGPVSSALIEDVRELDTAIFQSYGSTETVTHVALRALNPAALKKKMIRTATAFGDVPFQAIGKCTFSIDPRGCLVIYTPHLSTKKHVTNDLVDLINDTQFRWQGRWDNVILSGGKKIFPEQLETRTAGVIPYPHYFTSTPDDQLGQAVMLVLEANDPAELVLPEVMDRLMHILDPHELPRRVRALRTFARTDSGKVIRIEETA